MPEEKKGASAESGIEGVVIGVAAIAVGYLAIKLVKNVFKLSSRAIDYVDPDFEPRKADSENDSGRLT